MTHDIQLSSGIYCAVGPFVILLSPHGSAPLNSLHVKICNTSLKRLRQVVY